MKNALIVVDYQQDFVSGTLGFPGAEALDAPIAQAVENYRAQGWDIIYTLDTHFEDYMDTVEGQKLPISHCIKGTDGHALYGQVAQSRKDGDAVFEKVTFGSIELAAYLSAKNYNHVILCGLVAHICVLSNAVLAKSALPESRIAVAADLTLSPDPADKERALAALSGIHVDVI